jgi:hypothetical protein
MEKQMIITKMARGGGKTKLIVDLMVSNDNSVAVTFSNAARDLIIVRLTERGVPLANAKSRTFLADNFEEKSKGLVNVHTDVYVDELEKVLNQLLGSHVSVATMTPDPIDRMVEILTKTRENK